MLLKNALHCFWAGYCTGALRLVPIIYLHVAAAQCSFKLLRSTPSFVCLPVVRLPVVSQFITSRAAGGQSSIKITISPSIVLFVCLLKRAECDLYHILLNSTVGVQSYCILVLS